MVTLLIGPKLKMIKQLATLNKQFLRNAMLENSKVIYAYSVSILIELYWVVRKLCEGSMIRIGP
jgi:hypothetical protein